MSVPTELAEERSTRRWSALGGVLLSALYLWILLWLLLAIVLPTVGFGWQPAVITSGSMQPLIRPGDVVLTSPTSELEAGHVVTFVDPARDGTLTTHRVLGINEDGSLRTRGDANQSADSTPVPVDGVVGRGRMLVPLVGLPLVWLSTGFVLFALWAVATAISVMVVAGRTAGNGAPARGTSPAAPRPARPGLRRVLRPLGVLRPHRVQRALVARLVRVARRLHDAVYRGWRPNPPRARRAAPSTVILVITALLARSAASLAVSAVGLVLVLLFDPDGPQLRIGRWERLATRAVRGLRAVLPTPVLARGLLVIAAVIAVVAASAPTVTRSAAAFHAMDGNSGNYFTASTAFPSDADLTLWLQNEPEGSDTADATYSPMTTVEPAQLTLPNYDVGDDTAPGLRIQPGATSEFEPDDTRVQRWTHTPASDLTIASAEVLFHSALKDFVAGGATVTYYLRHCDTGGGDCVTMASTTASSADWQGGTTEFVARTTSFGTVSHVVPGGRQLELTLTVPSAASDLWFAYDTVDFRSRLEITTGTPGVCPGSGTSVQHVTADTRVEQDNPLDNYVTNFHLDAKSELDKNRRSLLAVALPIIPSGCSLTGATLLLTTAVSNLGRTIVTQRLDGPFTAGDVRWPTQPTASGPTGSGPSTAVGPTPIDATGPVGALYALGNTGLQVRDSAEDAAANHTNRFHSLEARPYPSPEGPRLQVTWGP